MDLSDLEIGKKRIHRVGNQAVVWINRLGRKRRWGKRALSQIGAGGQVAEREIAIRRDGATGIAAGNRREHADAFAVVSHRITAANHCLTSMSGEAVIRWLTT